MRQKYDITTDAGERVYTEPGDRGPSDMQIFTVFPKLPWKTTLAYVGLILRIKGMVEDRNYPPEAGYEGAWKLLKFIRDCIVRRKIRIRDLCKEYEIPGYAKKDNKCACGQEAAAGDKWCSWCRGALEEFDREKEVEA